MPLAVPGNNNTVIVYDIFIFIFSLESTHADGVAMKFKEAIPHNYSEYILFRKRIIDHPSPT